MNGWLELRRKRRLLPACMRGATLYLSAALATVFFAISPLAHAQQVTRLLPFAGTHSETWERFGVRHIPSGTSILGGIAMISGDHMETATSFQLCGVFARPSDGRIFFDSDRPTGAVTIAFSQPVSAFGAYWGSGVDCPVCCGYGDAPSILTFRDATGNIIGTDGFYYQGDGALMWRGYRFGTPVKTITRTAGDGTEGVAIDGLQANVGNAGRLLLANISTRSFVQTGNNVTIGGFIIEGTGPKTVILRAIGPELSAPPYNIPNALADPTLELHNGTGALIAFNDNWETTVIGGVITASQVSAIQNSGYTPTQASESAIIATLQPGNYTAIVRGKNNTVGVALAEVYDISLTTTSVLGNISTRGLVQTANNVMIGGFIVQGTGAKRVIVRAIGPELTQYGITNALANPTLELHNGSGALIASNDNWQTTILGGIITSNQVGDIQNSGHAPTAASESAIIADLQPGNYTAIVSGTSNTTGVALVEVYDLD
jgi:hypothetical protein